MAEKKEQPHFLPSIKDLVEARVHFGHQTSRWNPKMKRFIFGSLDGLYIIDLAKTLYQLKIAVEAIRGIVRKRKSILFVGTKKQAKKIIAETGEKTGEFYISERWLGGTLTNSPTIAQSIKKLDRIEKRTASGEGLTKKELSLLTKEQTKLQKNLSGIRGMRRLPGALVIVDTNLHHLAVKEARKLGIPIFAPVDTNCDPDLIQYPIPANDDALKSIKLILDTLAQAIIEEKQSLKTYTLQEKFEGEAPNSEANLNDEQRREEG